MQTSLICSCGTFLRTGILLLCRCGPEGREKHKGSRLPPLVCLYLVRCAQHKEHDKKYNAVSGAIFSPTDCAQKALTRDPPTDRPHFVSRPRSRHALPPTVDPVIQRSKRVLDQFEDFRRGLGHATRRTDHPNRLRLSSRRCRRFITDDDGHPQLRL